MSAHVIGEREVEAASPRAPLRRNRLNQLAGTVIALVAARVSSGVYSGLTHARDIIGDFESVHGPLQYTNGWWDHGSAPQAASKAFCSNLDAAAGWLYPFGVAVWLPVAALWIVAIALFTVRKPRSRYLAIAVAVTVVGLVAASFGSVYGDVIAVLE